MIKDKRKKKINFFLLTSTFHMCSVNAWHAFTIYLCNAISCFHFSLLFRFIETRPSNYHQQQVLFISSVCQSHRWDIHFLILTFFWLCIKMIFAWDGLCTVCSIKLGILNECIPSCLIKVFLACCFHKYFSEIICINFWM